MFDIFEIVSLLESFELDGQDYVFDLRTREWMKVCEIQVLVDTSFEFMDSSEKEKPTFTPPHKLPSDLKSESVNGDYLYLLKHFEEYKATFDQSTEDSKEESSEFEGEIIELQGEITELQDENSEISNEFIEIQKENSILQNDISELNSRVMELEKSLEQKGALNESLEDVIGEMNSDAISNSKTLNKLESELLESHELLAKEREKSSHELEEFKNFNHKKFEEVDVIEKKNYRLFQRNKALEFALKTEEQKYRDMKTVFDKYEKHSKREGLNERVLEKAFDYFVHGPVGGEQAKLEKKLEVLNNEISEKEVFYQSKIERLNDEISLMKKHHKENISISESQSKGRITLLSNDKKDLLHKLSKVEQDYIELKKKAAPAQREQFAIEKIAHLESDLSLAQKENKVQLKKIESLTSALSSTDVLDVSDSKAAEVKNNLRIEELESMNKKLISQVQKIENRKNEYKEEYKRLIKESKSSLKKIKSLEEKLKLVTKNQALDDSGAKEEIRKLKEELESYSSRLEIEQEKTVQLKVDLSKLKESEQNLQLVTSSNDDEELSRLIGDSFEVENDAIWTLQDDDGKKSGPFPFSKLYDMKEAGELSRESRVKKEGEAFKTCNDIFELSVPVTTHGEGEKRRFFVKRNSVRVPFYELVTFEISGEEYRGYCTSLSSGGIFIEMNKVDEEIFKMNGKGRVLFPGGTLENPFNSVAQIKNVSVGKPRGIGLMFIDLPDEAKEDILTYVNNFLNQNKKAA